MAGALFHMVAHGFMKITLFFCAGALHAHAHRSEIPQLAGIGRRMPITMTAFAVASLGLAGVPLFAGFISKWNLAVGAFDAGHGAYVALLVLSGLLTVAYLGPIVFSAFLDGPAAVEGVDEASPLLWAPLAITAAVSVVLGVWPDAGLSLLSLARLAAEAIVSASPGLP
jgi:formate hydrogenlyase subunit 3/multisubunit Na+/H+ antiporter MnhD subunit